MVACLATADRRPLQLGQWYQIALRRWKGAPASVFIINHQTINPPPPSNASVLAPTQVRSTTMAEEHPISPANPLPNESRYDRVLRACRNINDERFVSVFVNLIRAALPLAGQFLHALDIVMAEETGDAGTAGVTGDAESMSEIDETPFMPEGSARSQPSEPSTSTSTTWYSVVRGTRVGVFRDL